MDLDAEKLEPQNEQKNGSGVTYLELIQQASQSGGMLDSGVSIGLKVEPVFGGSPLVNIISNKDGKYRCALGLGNRDLKKHFDGQKEENLGGGGRKIQDNKLARNFEKASLAGFAMHLTQSKNKEIFATVINLGSGVQEEFMEIALNPHSKETAMTWLNRKVARKIKALGIHHCMYGLDQGHKAGTIHLHVVLKCHSLRKEAVFKAIKSIVDPLNEYSHKKSIKSAYFASGWVIYGSNPKATSTCSGRRKTHLRELFALSKFGEEPIFISKPLVKDYQSVRLALCEFVRNPSL